MNSQDGSSPHCPTIFAHRLPYATPYIESMLFLYATNCSLFSLKLTFHSMSIIVWRFGSNTTNTVSLVKGIDLLNSLCTIVGYKDVLTGVRAKSASVFNVQDSIHPNNSSYPLTAQHFCKTFIYILYFSVRFPTSIVITTPCMTPSLAIPLEICFLILVLLLLLLFFFLSLFCFLNLAASVEVNLAGLEVLPLPF